MKRKAAKETQRVIYWRSIRTATYRYFLDRINTIKIKLNHRILLRKTNNSNSISVGEINLNNDLSIV